MFCSDRNVRKVRLCVPAREMKNLSQRGLVEVELVIGRTESLASLLHVAGFFEASQMDPGLPSLKQAPFHLPYFIFPVSVLQDSDYAQFTHIVCLTTHTHSHRPSRRQCKCISFDQAVPMVSIKYTPNEKADTRQKQNAASHLMLTGPCPSLASLRTSYLPFSSLLFYRVPDCLMSW